MHSRTDRHDGWNSNLDRCLGTILKWCIFIALVFLLHTSLYLNIIILLISWQPCVTCKIVWKEVSFVIKYFFNNFLNFQCFQKNFLEILAVPMIFRNVIRQDFFFFWKRYSYLIFRVQHSKCCKEQVDWNPKNNKWYQK